MAIVINGSGTVAGLAVGGLPDDTVDAGSLANSINSEITANTAKTGITSAQATAITAALPKAGGTMTGHLLLGDNDYIQIGNSQDLKIFHDSSNSYINDTGTGDLIISGSNNVRIKSAGGEDMIIANADNAVTLYHNNVARMSTSSAGILVGATASPNSSNSGVQLANNYDGNNNSRSSSGSVTAFRHHFVFYNGNGAVGSISTNGSATAFNTSSDYRLKENVNYTWDATTRLKQLKPARFNFIADDTNTLVDGFIAHEAATVVPECVAGTKDAMRNETDEEGNVTSVPDMQGIDQSKLVPLLVKTIQELEARITALEVT